MMMKRVFMGVIFLLLALPASGTETWSPTSGIGPGLTTYSFTTAQTSKVNAHQCGSMVLGFEAATGGTALVEACSDALCTSAATIVNLTTDTDSSGPYNVGWGYLRVTTTITSGTAEVSFRCGKELGGGDSGGGLANVVEDTAPQLGGNLDTNGFGIDYSEAVPTDWTTPPGSLEAGADELASRTTVLEAGQNVENIDSTNAATSPLFEPTSDYGGGKLIEWQDGLTIGLLRIWELLSGGVKVRTDPTTYSMRPALFDVARRADRFMDLDEGTALVRYLDKDSVGGDGTTKLLTGSTAAFSTWDEATAAFDAAGNCGMFLYYDNTDLVHVAADALGGAWSGDDARVGCAAVTDTAIAIRPYEPGGTLILDFEGTTITPTAGSALGVLQCSEVAAGGAGSCYFEGISVTDYINRDIVNATEVTNDGIMDIRLFVINSHGNLVGATTGSSMNILTAHQDAGVWAVNMTGECNGTFSGAQNCIAASNRSYIAAMSSVFKLGDDAGSGSHVLFAESSKIDLLGSVAIADGTMTNGTRVIEINPIDTVPAQVTVIRSTVACRDGNTNCQLARSHATGAGETVTFNSWESWYTTDSDGGSGSYVLYFSTRGSGSFYNTEFHGNGILGITETSSGPTISDVDRMYYDLGNDGSNWNFNATFNALNEQASGEYWRFGTSNCSTLADVLAPSCTAASPSLPTGQFFEDSVALSGGIFPATRLPIDAGYAGANVSKARATEYSYTFPYAWPSVFFGREFVEYRAFYGE